MDVISNMIIQMKNAGNVGLEEVTLPYSKFKQAILDVLKKEGFVKSVEVGTKKGKKVLRIELFLENRVPKIKGVERISKPSRRIYKGASELRPVKNGYGALVVSTSKGVMSGREARKAGLGGEALFAIW
ncbi:MAG: 30S ribosomal protein S8 [Minisyncoccia bacterium]